MKYVERKKHIMSTNTETVRRVQAEFANIQSKKKTLEGNHEMTLREAVRALYPTLQRMKKRGFTTREMAQKLNENGIVIKPATLAKYLNELEKEKCRRKKAEPKIRTEAPHSKNNLNAQKKKMSSRSNDQNHERDTTTTSETE